MKMAKTSGSARNLAILGLGLMISAISHGVVGCAGDRYNRSTGEYIDDQSLRLRVDHALNANPDYKFTDISLATFKGMVQLNGFVDMADQKTKAGDIVKQVQGVREVENNIIVEEQGKRSAGEAEDDRALAGRVRDALHTNPEYKFDDVAVAGYKGTVRRRIK